MNARIISLAAIVSVMLAVATQAEAEVKIEMKPAAVLSGGTIQIAQVALVSSDDSILTDTIGSTPLGATPLPGNARRVTRRHVTQHLARKGIDITNIAWRGPTACTVTVRTHRVTAEQIVKAARDYLTAMPLLRRDDVSIEVESMPRERLYACGDKTPVLSASLPRLDKPYGRVRVNVKVKLGERILGSIPLMFRITCRRKIVFAARPIRRGETINRSHLETQEILMGPASGSETYFEKESDITGKPAAQPIMAGVPLTTSMVSEPLAVRKGESATIVLRWRNLEITAKGVAHEDAYVGDLLLVTIAPTGKKLRCKVIGPGTVELPF